MDQLGAPQTRRTRPYTVGDYLLDRLAELGVGHVFGVPGDYTLRLLDHVEARPDLRWVGCTNELNAGYAADGYGRMRGIATLMTTFGVGELSAINAIAGSYAEHVPVVHVVGAPATGTQSAHRIVHHSLGDGLFTHFLDMHEKITCARAALTVADASAEMDRVLTEVRDQRLPGYLLLPLDVAEAPATRPAAPLAPAAEITDPMALAAFEQAAARILTTAGDVCRVRALVGVLVHRLGATRELQQLLAAGPLEHASCLWAKSTVDETNLAYLGIYAGRASDPVVREAIEEAGVLIVAGVQFTDLTSGFFTHRIPRRRTIELGPATASVGEVAFGPIAMTAALSTLAGLVARLGPASEPAPERPGQPPPEDSPVAEATLDQTLLWPRVAAHLRPGDIVVAEQGTSFYGMAPLRLPAGVSFIGQPLWASIGYTLPATLGACLARPGSRGVLLIGDGAAQMTAQELSTVLRERVPAVVLVVDNDGYTVERAIHGPEQPYNDIAGWSWERLPEVFAPQASPRASVVRTVGELEAALLAASHHPTRLTLVRAMLPRLDVPQLLAMLARALGEANAAAADRHEAEPAPPPSVEPQPARGPLPPRRRFRTRLREAALAMCTAAAGSAQSPWHPAAYAGLGSLGPPSAAAEPSPPVVTLGEVDRSRRAAASARARPVPWAAGR